MPRYLVRIVRSIEWEIEVDADDESDAKIAAEDKFEAENPAPDSDELYTSDDVTELED